MSIAPASKEDPRVYHWVLYTVNDDFEFVPEGEFHGTRAEVDERFPKLYPRLKVFDARYT